MSKTRLDSIQKDTDRENISPNVSPAIVKKTPAPKKRKIKDDDRSWRPGGQGKNPNGNYFELRTNNATTVVDGEGNSIPLKTAAMFNQGKLKGKSNLDWEMVGEVIAEELAHISTNRPVAEVVKKTANGSPIQVRTPQKTILDCHEDYGSVRCFSNQPVKTLTSPIKTIPKNGLFFQTQEYAAVVPPTTDTKTFFTDEPRKLAAKAKKEKSRNGGRRVLSQRKVMAMQGNGVSADELIQAAQKDIPLPETEYEYTHVIDVDAVGEGIAQTPETLIIGTKGHNTKNMFGEAAARIIRKEFSESQQQNSAEVIPGTHFGVTMQQTCTTTKFTFPLEYNPQDPTVPLNSDGKAILAATKGMVKAAKSKDKSKTQSSITTKSSTLFYHSENQSTTGENSSLLQLTDTKPQMV